MTPIDKKIAHQIIMAKSDNSLEIGPFVKAIKEAVIKSLPSVPRDEILASGYQECIAEIKEILK